MQNEQEKVCCPPFDPSTWDGKTVTWKDKLFIRGSIPTFLHIPVGNLGKLMTRLQASADAVGASINNKDYLILANDPTAWRSDYYLAVSKEVPGADNVKLSGTFFARVFDGPYRDAPKWLAKTSEELKADGKSADNFYFFYTTCPKCAKKYGHNYVVVLAQIA